MIKKATVRRARMTGYQKKNRKVKGDVFLNKEWIGKRVIVVSLYEYVDFKKALRNALTRLKQIQRLSK